MHKQKLENNKFLTNFTFFITFFFSPKNKEKVGEKIFEETIEEDTSINIKIKKNISSMKFKIFK